VRRWDWPFAALVASVLTVLRCLQLRSTAHRLYDPEWVDFIVFSEHLRAGTVVTENIEQFMHTYQHQGASQGVAAVQIGAAALGSVMGATCWSLHAVTMLCEVALVVVLALLLRRIATRRLAALAIAPVLLVPSFVVTWQLLPFGNHSEFFVLPALLALFLAGGPLRERPLWHWLLPLFVVAMGFFLYRVLLAPALAFAVVTLLFARGRARALGPLVVALGLALSVAALGFAFGRESFSPLLGNLSLLAPRMEPSTSALVDQLTGGWLFKLPRAPRTTHLGLIYPIILLLGPALLALMSLRYRAAVGHPVVVSFAVAWALAGMFMPSLSSALRPEYLLTGVYGLLLCWALLVVIPWPVAWTRLVAVGALALALLGGLDSARYIQPSVWSASADYEGVAFRRQLGLHWVDSDDVPYFARIIKEGRADLSMSFATLFLECPWDTSDAAGRVPGGRIADLAEGHCEGWQDGELAGHIRDYHDLEPASQTGLDTGYMQVGGVFNADAVGRGAWILCNRDLERVERALQGLSTGEAEPILAGARAEAQLWPVPQ
jgi:hypothetical protein